MLDSGFGKKFWEETVRTATYLQNRSFTKAAPKTAFKMWNGKRSDFDQQI